MIDSQSYLLKISQAGPIGLVVINFEILLDYLGAAKKAAPLDILKRNAIIKGMDALSNLIQSLDFNISLSHDFYDIYRYSYGKLAEAAETKGENTDIILDEVIELMNILLAGWLDVAEKNPEQPANKAPKVYSGLTYDKDGNPVEYIDNENRGYTI